MVFRFVIKKSPLPLKAHFDVLDIPRTLGQLENRSMQVVLGKLIPFAVSSSRSLLGHSISRQSKDDGYAFSFRCHILHSRDCVWYILEVRPPNG